VKEAQDAGHASRRPRKKTNTKMASNTVFMADPSFEPATHLVTATTSVSAVWHIHQRAQRA
jgi:hypothetical protein